MLIPRISKIAGRVLVVCAVLSIGSLAWAQAEDEGACSDRTLRGDYGFTVEGTLALPGGTLLNGAGLPLRGLALAHYDGKGNLTQVDHIVVNGMPPPVAWTPGTGTYRVNPDCTGVETIYSASSATGPVHLHFVVVRNGKEIHQVVDANAVTAIGIKVE